MGYLQAQRQNISWIDSLRKKQRKYLSRHSVYCYHADDRYGRNVPGRMALLWKVSISCTNDDSAHPSLSCHIKYFYTPVDNDNCGGRNLSGLWSKQLYLKTGRHPDSRIFLCPAAQLYSYAIWYEIYDLPFLIFSSFNDMDLLPVSQGPLHNLYYGGSLDFEYSNNRTDCRHFPFSGSLYDVEGQLTNVQEKFTWLWGIAYPLKMRKNELTDIHCRQLVNIL